jgi:hypothetical protein
MAGGIGSRGGRLGRPPGRGRGGRRRGSRGGSRGGGAQSSAPPPTRGRRGRRGRRGEGSRAGGQRHWIKDPASSSPLPSPSPPSTPEPEPIDGFEFGVTLNYGKNPDSIRLPHKFKDIVDVRTNQVVLRVGGDAIGIWPMKLLFDCTGTLTKV